MQAVILAAGRGTRMGALTDALPKPMLEVDGKSLMARKLEMLEGLCDEVVIIVGYKGAVIREKLGDRFGTLPLTYVEQTELNGTGGAVHSARPHLRDRFVVLMGDDLYSAHDVQAVAAEPDWAMLVERTRTMAEGGNIVLDVNGRIIGIEEGDHTGKPGIMNTNMLLLDMRFFDQPLVPKAAGSAEYGLPQTALAAAEAFAIPFKAVNATGWIQVTAPADIVKAERRLAGLE